MVNIQGPPSLWPKKDRGFTLLEILTVLTIIGFMITAVSVVMSRSIDDFSIQQAVNDMDKIRVAVRDGFYRDTGLIPQSFNIDIITQEPYPEFATQYLCLKNDCDQDNIKRATHNMLVGMTMWGRNRTTPADYVKCDELGSSGTCQLRKLCWFFYYMTKPSNFTFYPKDGPIKRAFLYNPGFKEGWNGPYLEANTTARDQDGDDVPLVAVPWASGIEQAAREAEENGDESLGALYRKGKYYHIRVKLEENKELRPWCDVTENPVSEGKYAWPLDRNGPRQDKNTARIICYGENGLDDGSYCKEYDGMGNCVAETTIEELKDPDFDIGDDLVMYIFADGFTRSPLDNN